jgi:hypothetical protein
MTLVEDRRRQRSNDPLVALHYQLARTRQEGHLDAIVVADDSGVVVAGAGAWAVCEELGAYAPLLAQGVWIEPGANPASRVATLGVEVAVQAVDVQGQTVLLCARGGEGRKATLDRAAKGVARILGTSA